MSEDFSVEPVGCGVVVEGVKVLSSHTCVPFSDYLFGVVLGVVLGVRAEAPNNPSSTTVEGRRGNQKVWR